MLKLSEQEEVAGSHSWMLLGEGPTITGRTALTTTWHRASGEQFCCEPVCCETETWRMPEGGGVANKVSGMRTRINELESMETFGKESMGVTPLICVLFTYTLFVDMKFVPVMYTS